MSFKELQTYFKFSKEQRTGILSLFIIIISLQCIYFFTDFSSKTESDPQKQEWLSLQAEVDSMKLNRNNSSPKIYLFNPNFITDYKGYKLGMSVEEIDRLFEFRKTNKYVNSAEEFQQVTKVSDSLLKEIAPLFKFPDWLNNRKEFKSYNKFPVEAFAKNDKIVVIDINEATKEDLIKVYGVGEAISLRILKQKEIIGGFVSMDQMTDVWGLSPEVIEKLNLHFKVLKVPAIKKVDINNASLKDLSQFHYFRYALAKDILTYRSMNGDFKNIEDLTKVKGFPVDKAKIISLYLDFN
ncbi:ComEA family DNA-binding protein [Flavobacterium weaverense]|uniref:DNA uptake protein ComE-like DNA-binding protein n=1 Tax=Flavobacterium weaverense TaxID=271156 RepID=A0A3L9ZRH4_9FLAO|nr:helix-hairpin-helix domain-containing protein [Flavobacterium weaverense]RMA74877.1 DNA uptake protein ComE-like DNA-binding protein [Flavobacterium weaverense]